MSQNAIPNKVIVTLMTWAAVSFCKNRKTPHNTAPVSQMGPCVDGHPQGWLLGLSSSFLSLWQLFFFNFFIGTVFTYRFHQEVIWERKVLALSSLWSGRWIYLITQDSLLSDFWKTQISLKSSFFHGVDSSPLCYYSPGYFFFYS